MAKIIVVESKVNAKENAIEKAIEKQMEICDKCIELFGTKSELTRNEFATLGELTYLSKKL